MKKFILVISILVLLFIVVAGAVGFDYYKLSSLNHHKLSGFDYHNVQTSTIINLQTSTITNLQALTTITFRPQPPQSFRL